jgi:hypothetical protein
MFNYRPLLSRGRFRPVFAATVGAFALASLAPAAHADIVFFEGAGFVQPEENVLLNFNLSGATITGTTNQSGTLITFSQPDLPENLITPSNGQASIQAGDGAFTSLRTAVSSGTTFTLFEANPSFLTGGTLFTVRVTEDNGQVSNRTFTAGNGQSFFGVQAVANQRISFIDILAPANSISEVSQVRIGGISTAANPVPEPSEWVAMGMAAASVGGLMVRARRKASNRRAVTAAA